MNDEALPTGSFSRSPLPPTSISAKESEADATACECHNLEGYDNNITVKHFQRFTHYSHYPECETTVHSVTRSALGLDYPRSAVKKINHVEPLVSCGVMPRVHTQEKGINI